MATHPLWSDDYWLLLLQLYLKKPEGMKPMYSRALVDLSLELHIISFEAIILVMNAPLCTLDTLTSDFHGALVS